MSIVIYLILLFTRVKIRNIHIYCIALREIVFGVNSCTMNLFMSVICDQIAGRLLIVLILRCFRFSEHWFYNDAVFSPFFCTMSAPNNSTRKNSS